MIKLNDNGYTEIDVTFQEYALCEQDMLTTGELTDAKTVKMAPKGGDGGDASRGVHICQNDEFAALAVKSGRVQWRGRPAYAMRQAARGLLTRPECDRKADRHYPVIFC